jgi:hypothetical protein
VWTFGRSTEIMCDVKLGGKDVDMNSRRFRVDIRAQVIRII